MVPVVQIHSSVKEKKEKYPLFLPLQPHPGVWTRTSKACHEWYQMPKYECFLINGMKSLSQSQL